MLVGFYKERDSNFELLRIFAMALIVLHHFSMHSNFAYDTSIVTFNRLLVQFMAFGGKVGVDCFVLISGYFLITQQFRLKKLLKLLCSIWFYSIVILLCCKGAHFMEISWDFLIQSLVPLYSVNWFAYIYLILYLLSPSINNWIRSISKNDFIKILLLLTFIWCVIPFFFSKADMGISNLAWFVYLYCIGGFIRLYVHRSFSIKCIGAGLLGVITFMYATIWLVDIIGIYVPRVVYFIGDLTNYVFHFYDQNSIFVICISIGLFLFFKNLKVQKKWYINSLASTMFGVYLIHDNPIIRHMIWLEWFKNPTHMYSNHLWIWAGVEVIAVLSICALIERVRIISMEKPLFSMLDPKIDILEMKCIKHINKVVARINVWINNY